MNYSIKDFKKEFPDDKACLDYIFKKKYSDLKGYYFVKGRKCYANAEGKQIHPVKGTIFEHSSTPLNLWFYAIFLFSASRNGVSAKELQRQLGVTYKCAYRIGQQIRSLMKSGNDMLSGDVEMDETYFGGRVRAGRGNMGQKEAMKNKTVIIGAVERKGRLNAEVSPNGKAKTVGAFLNKNINQVTSRLFTDESNRYHSVARGYNRFVVNHKRAEYVRGLRHTNTIEGFWSQFKRSVSGTHHAVSKKHLQSYLDEFVFRRNVLPAVFEAMVARI